MNHSSSRLPITAQLRLDRQQKYRYKLIQLESTRVVQTPPNIFTFYSWLSILYRNRNSKKESPNICELWIRIVILIGPKCGRLFLGQRPLQIFHQKFFKNSDPDRDQNLIRCSLGQAPPPKISSKSVHNFLSNLAYRQTDEGKNRTSFFRRR